MTVWKVQTMVMPAGAEIRDGVVGREPPEDGLDGVAGHRSVDWDFFACYPACDTRLPVHSVSGCTWLLVRFHLILPTVSTFFRT